MKIYPKEEAQEKYKNLPPQLKEALSDPEIMIILSRLGEKFKLPEEKIKKLKKICGLVFLGLLPVEEVKNEIKERLWIGNEGNQLLTENLEREVFSKYKGDLTSLYGAEEEKSKEREQEKLSELLQKLREKGPRESLVKQPETKEKKPSGQVHEDKKMARETEKKKMMIEQEKVGQEKVGQEKVKQEKVKQEKVKQEKVEQEKELLKKKGPDKYREEILKEEASQSRVVKEEGKIKKIF